MVVYGVYLWPVAQVVCATDNPFVQSINEARVPAYHRGRICLIGDASTLVRPHTAAGSVKAMTDALALSNALSAWGPLDAALKAWGSERCAAGRTPRRAARAAAGGDEAPGRRLTGRRI